MNGRLTELLHERRRFQDRKPRARLAKTIAVALALGVLVYLITNLLVNDQNGPEFWSLTLSVFLGGLALVTQVLLDFESRLVRLQEAHETSLSDFGTHLTSLQQAQDKCLSDFGERLVAVEKAEEQHAEEIGERVKAGFLKINQATELFGLVEASALRTDAVIQLVKHSTQIDPTSPPLILRFAQAEIGRMSGFLKEISDGGNVTYEGEDRDWMLSLAQNAELSIDATSLTTVDAGGKGFVDGGLWSSDLGQRYLEVQREAVQRDVRVRRVFIMDRSDLVSDPDFVEVCSLQREIGISVRVLDWSAIPGMRRSSLFDFVLFDDVISYETTPASSRIDGHTKPTIVNTRLELRPARVKDRIVRYRDLWSYAREPSQ
jgi:hypothetical protein